MQLRPIFLATAVAALGSTFSGSSSAQPAPLASGDLSIPDRFLTGPAIEEQARQQQRLNQSVMSGISAKAGSLLSSPTVATRLSDIGGELRYGAHRVVSPSGEHVINLIRTLATTDAGRRQALFAELTEAGQRGVPEATNFLGFASEYGLFGMRQDSLQAQALYSQAAQARYMPALFNRGLAAAYGRDGSQDLSQASARLDLAMAAGPDASGRVCGMGAFINFRRKSPADAARFAERCPSPLASLVTESLDPSPLTSPRIERLRITSAAGVDDGLYLLETLAKRTAGTDVQLTYCKYALLNRYRAAKPGSFDLKQAARRCADATGPKVGSTADEMRRAQAVAGAASFVISESAAIDRGRASNHFHYSWSVPYLPFPQTEMALFEPLVLAAQRKQQP